ncbi:hypothetical protein [Agrilutibacter solisilvae]|uniref:Uncharacterized protein n=1 Tax=Agrilutibacter solisilvae TaxID=2763317 RepID=A0A974Y3T7_9GAMM|nr:hypothetical protein [Lysobacter solisilvae]QSX80135.1 hypothetical protein I8J32_014090 [Lysobacter solisilvae]
MRLVLHRYLPSSRASVRHAPESAVLEWDVQDQAARLRRLAALLEDSGTPLDRRRLDQVEELLSELEQGLDTMKA